jgi:hypothetical protein
MKKYLKKLPSIIIFILIALFFKWCSTGFIIQEHLNKNSNIGKKIQFAQPISYIERETSAIVPIVARIKKEIESLHIKYDSEQVNKYIQNSTIFTIEDAYAYKDFLNSRTIYYILSNQKVKYILSEGTLSYLQKPIYKNAQMPIKILDKLYKNKLYATANIRFYSSEKNGRYYDVLSISKFEECNINDATNNKGDITASVNFTQLSCLYSKLWDSRHSKTYPVKYEILNKY